MRRYLQLIIVLTSFGFLVWLRNAKFEDEVTAGIKLNIENNTLNNNLSPIPEVSRIQNIDTNIFITVTPTILITPETLPTRNGLYKNGTYTGSVVDAYYGSIQVQIVILGGLITDVVFLQYPSDNSTSRSINSQAIPILKEEVIVAQSAEVSGVSGASATSPAFITSLSSALAQAKK